MPAPNEINELFQRYHGRPANQGEIQKFVGATPQALENLLIQTSPARDRFTQAAITPIRPDAPVEDIQKYGESAARQGRANIPLQRMTQANITPISPDAPVEDIQKYGEAAARLGPANLPLMRAGGGPANDPDNPIQELTEEDFFRINRDEILDTLNREKYDELYRELQEDYDTATGNERRDIERALANLDRSRRYFQEDRQTDLGRLGGQRRYATEDYEGSRQAQEFRNRIAQRNLEGSLNQRGIRRGGIADHIRREQAQIRQQPLSNLQKAYKRRVEQFDQRQGDIQRGLSRYDEDYRSRRGAIEDQRERSRVSRERTLKRRRRGLGQQRDQELGTILTDRHQEQLRQRPY